ncbi:hypothetical protein CVS40_6338 [Lucilia cuprina]|nr:hypothetical protein CVS40_6338 [Lucilia cuprina]
MIEFDIELILVQKQNTCCFCIVVVMDMNTRVPRQDTRKRWHAYGLALEIQNDILNNMSQMMSEIRVVEKKTLLPFQKGIHTTAEEFFNRFNI